MYDYAREVNVNLPSPRLDWYLTSDYDSIQRAVVEHASELIYTVGFSQFEVRQLFDLCVACVCACVFACVRVRARVCACGCVRARSGTGNVAPQSLWDGSLLQPHSHPNKFISFLSVRARLICRFSMAFGTRRRSTSSSRSCSTSSSLSSPA